MPRKLILFLMLVGSLAFASCSREVGHGDPENVETNEATFQDVESFIRHYKSKIQNEPPQTFAGYNQSLIRARISEVHVFYDNATLDYIVILPLDVIAQQKEFSSHLNWKMIGIPGHESSTGPIFKKMQNIKSEYLIYSKANAKGSFYVHDLFQLP